MVQSSLGGDWFEFRVIEKQTFALKKVQKYSIIFSSAIYPTPRKYWNYLQTSSILVYQFCKHAIIMNVSSIFNQVPIEG